ncbi:claudin-34-like [Brienomyrus brachyistius]|uniref:claudin-34-like n=1 Tax=Brienomyrus brachyistius TaxID=42636 RepID=UPI0020B3B5A5|nr:claudin-34-like [Brienomyrus brachyistius]XP_048835434.1 claudin-34-like [Brienomyrus brachyistius]
MYLVHTSHPQFVGFCLGLVGWILSVVTIGIIQWRVWYTADTAVITSGVAWVGIWRVCFYSRWLVTSQYQLLFCQPMKIWDTFVSFDIRAAQVLTLVAAVTGVGGNVSAAYGLQKIFFGIEEQKLIMTAFRMAGTLYLLAGVCSLLPLAWNVYSVVGNHTIAFPSSFHMPSAPVKQEVGDGIGIGIIASIIMMSSGFVFLSYRFPVVLLPRDLALGQNKGESDSLGIGKSYSQRSVPHRNKNTENLSYVRENPAFQVHV